MSWMATLCRSPRSHFRLMVCSSSQALGMNQCGCGTLQQEKSSMFWTTTLTGSTQSHFRLMVSALSLAYRIIQCGYGIVWNLTTLESRPKIPPMASYTLDGFFPQTHKCTSCLFHLMHGCPTLPTSLLCLPLLSPLLISPMWPLDLNGMIVTIHSFHIPLYSPLKFFWCPVSLISFPVLVFYLFSLLYFVVLFTLFRTAMIWNLWTLSQHQTTRVQYHGEAPSFFSYCILPWLRWHLSNEYPPDNTV